MVFRPRLQAALVLLVTVAGAARPCAAADVRGGLHLESDLVKQGMAAYDALEYPRAVGLLGRALQESLTRDEKLATYQTLAFAHVALDQADAAVADFVSLLAVDPSFELDRTISPRVRTVFERAKAEVALGPAREDPELARLPTLAPTVTWGFGARPHDGHGVDIAGDLSGLSMFGSGAGGSRCALFYRTRGQPLYVQLSAPLDGGRFRVTVPGLGVHAPALEYYLVILDEGGASVARAGSLGQPLAVEVDGGKTAIYKRGWFWGVLVAAAVVGAGVATAVALTARSGPSPGAPATIVVQPQLTIAY